jgi:hypothetical protein
MFIRETRMLRSMIALRIRAIRQEHYGDRGVDILAAHLELPVRTWEHYESGVTIPGEVLLRFMVETGVSASWVLTGEGARYIAADAAISILSAN